MLTELTIAACPYCGGECDCVMAGLDKYDSPRGFLVYCTEECGYCGREMESEPEAVEVHNTLCRNNAAAGRDVYLADAARALMLAARGSKDAERFSIHIGELEMALDRYFTTDAALAKGEQA